MSPVVNYVGLASRYWICLGLPLAVTRHPVSCKVNVHFSGCMRQTWSAQFYCSLAVLLPIPAIVIVCKNFCTSFLMFRDSVRVSSALLCSVQFTIQFYSNMTIFWEAICNRACEWACHATWSTKIVSVFTYADLSILGCKIILKYDML